jgi:hypothetical protein
MQQLERVTGGVVEGFFNGEDGLGVGLGPRGGGVTGREEDFRMWISGEEFGSERDAGVVREGVVLGQELGVPVFGGPVEGVAWEEILEVEGLVPGKGVLRVFGWENGVVVVDVGKA